MTIYGVGLSVPAEVLTNGGDNYLAKLSERLRWRVGTKVTENAPITYRLTDAPFGSGLELPWTPGDKVPNWATTVVAKCTYDDKLDQIRALCEEARSYGEGFDLPARILELLDGPTGD